MKRIRSDIVLLVVIILLFGASVLFLQWKIAAQRVTQKPQTQSVRLPYVSDLKMSSELQPLLYTRSISAIVDTLKKLDADTMCSMARAVVYDAECPLNVDERFSLLLALATSVSYNHALQDRIFTMLADFYKQRGIEPLLLATVRSEYAAATIDLLSWAQRAYPALGKTWVQQAFKGAIDRQDIQLLEALYMRGVRITSEQASDFLWYIVQNNKTADLVPFFAKWGKADLNYIGPNGRSLLAQALHKKKNYLAQVLAAEGAGNGPRRILRAPRV